MEENSLTHYGVLGMKWGVRKDGKPQGYKPDRKMVKTAKADAKKMAKANVAYGAGAGTQRSLMKKQVNSRSKNADYKKAYEEAYAKQNHERLAAKSYRKHDKDVAKANRSNGVNRAIEIGGALIGAGLGAAAAVKLNSVDSVGSDQKFVADMLLVSGGLALGRAVGSIPNRQTMNARRRLNYNY